jgi:hypothetical protein
MLKLSVFISIKFVLLIYALTFIFASPANNNFVEVNNKNYNDFLNKSEYTLLFFYDTASTKSKKYDNVLKETLMRLVSESQTSDKRESLHAKEILDKVSFGKVDAYKNKELASEYEIEKFPSIKFIRPKSNLINEITESFDINTVSTQQIINYLKKRVVRPWENLSSIDQLKDINKDNNINLVLCDQPQSNITELINRIIIHYDDVFLSKVDYNSTNSNLTEFLKCQPESPEIIIFKNFDEKEVRFSNFSPDKIFSPEEINKFLASYTSPLVSELNEISVEKILLKHIPALVYLYKKEPELQSYQLFYSAAKLYRGKILFFKLSIKNDYTIALIDGMQIRKKQLPNILALYMTSSELLKYKLNQGKKKKEITSDNLSQFIESFAKRELKAYRVSEKLNFTNPYFTGEGSSIYKIVADNFEKEILAREECSLIYTYIKKIPAPIKIILEKISKILVEKNEKILVGVAETGLNEIHEINESYKLYLYTSKKGNNFKIFDEKLTFKNILIFLSESNCINIENFEIPEEKDLIKNINTFRDEDKNDFNFDSSIIYKQVLQVNEMSSNQQVEKIQEIKNENTPPEVKLDSTKINVEDESIKSEINKLKIQKSQEKGDKSEQSLNNVQKSEAFILEEDSDLRKKSDL